MDQPTIPEFTVVVQNGQPVFRVPINDAPLDMGAFAALLRVMLRPETPYVMTIRPREPRP